MSTFPAFSMPLIPFTTEKITGCTTEAAKVIPKLHEIQLLVFLFHVLLFQ